jgi:hypothetical protein
LCEDAVTFGAILETRRNQPLGEQRVRRAEFREHVERRWVKRRGARFPAQLGPGLEYGDGHTSAHEVRGRDQTDRASPCNQHAIIISHDGGDVRASCRPQSLFDIAAMIAVTTRSDRIES